MPEVKELNMRLDGIIAAVIVSLTLCSPAKAKEICLPFGGLSEPVCGISYVKLISSPDDYDGKFVDFISVISLNVDEETIFLYPFTESREINNISEVVRLDSSAQKYIAERRIKSGDWVRVVGRFHKRDPEGEWQLHLGVVADLVLVSPRERGNLPHEKK